MKNDRFRDWLLEEIEINERCLKRYQDSAEKAWKEGESKKAIELERMCRTFNDSIKSFKEVIYMYDICKEES